MTARTVPVHLYVRPGLRRVGDRLLVRGWLAITIGTSIVSWRVLDPAELAHEFEHVRQWRRHGTAAYVARYALASLRAVLAGGDWYRDNAFEREAREAARRATPASVTGSPVTVGAAPCTVPRRAPPA
jgi:hypothetical protein